MFNLEREELVFSGSDSRELNLNWNIVDKAWLVVGITLDSLPFYVWTDLVLVKTSGKQRSWTVKYILTYSRGFHQITDALHDIIRMFPKALDFSKLVHGRGGDGRCLVRAARGVDWCPLSQNQVQCDECHKHRKTKDHVQTFFHDHHHVGVKFHFSLSLCFTCSWNISI